ncbi:hypothetical protein [Permianibacter aggregans]|uniref:Uncharacterized protein n=1 Tax=Permianibacter aggregans TaxID=1510150 RepID=A0A4R6UHC7_9GAMM|nr:hypothetical protein [Permianibacter aggregans]QGX39933.1 hypothetical protein E2H98_09785 [Permianibacter aggregans]TDQ46260.1 hypothetical protein EV696_11445 [Permianibacter aggregans]
MENKQKLFAFKVIAKESRQAVNKDGKWLAREGVATAGCTDPRGWGAVRYSNWWGGVDAGAFC